ncbi:MAG: hypothetical protein JW866_09115 [Ignavibacteriales bacterium]|nr:hypothetical protein [Ignavibacteriales bacterium]
MKEIKMIRGVKMVSTEKLQIMKGLIRKIQMMKKLTILDFIKKKNIFVTK